MGCSEVVRRAPLRVAFLCQNLNAGGAERQLAALACGLAQRGLPICVVSFYGGSFEAPLLACGVRVVNLNKRGRWDVAPFFCRLIRSIRQVQADVVYSFLPVPNVIAALLRPFLPPALLVWGLRSSDMDLSRYDTLSRFSYSLERRLAFAADLIVANSRKGMAVAAAKGFNQKRLQVIPNGINIDLFKPNVKLRGEVRGELGVEGDAPVIGLVARFDPMKDHRTFLGAARILARRFPLARFALVGKGVDLGNPVFAKALAGELAERVLLLGERADISRLMNAFDVCCLSSAFGEGFPNVLGEAMASGVPCVSTDVGDAAWIIGDTGLVVPPRDPAGLAEALLRLISRSADEKERMRAAARERIVANFSSSALIERTERLLINEFSKRRAC